MSEIDKRLYADDDLEAEATKRGAFELHPWIKKIQHKAGMLNVIRNAKNAREVQVKKAEEADQG